MANMTSALLGTGWYDEFDGETIEYKKGGKDLTNEFGIGGAGIIFLIRPDKSYTGAHLSHYGYETKFEEVFDDENIPIDDTPLVQTTKSNQFSSLHIKESNNKISVTSPLTGTGNVSVYSTSGRKILEKSVNLTQGSNDGIMSTNGLANGTYLFTVSVGSNNYNKRLIIQN